MARTYTAAESAAYWKKKATEGGVTFSKPKQNWGVKKSGTSEQKKHSGCHAGKDKNDNPYVQGWKYSRRDGMRSFLATPYSKTKSVKSADSGIEWQNWMVKISQEGKLPQITGGMYNPATKKVIVKDLGYIMNPKGGKGGYVGTFINK
ncbi:MAG: hypothetical protein JWN76_1242 [Chitinophagaceae bacterium]|nr:hypothetical protein [Chitinophagaceae bacterium]